MYINNSPNGLNSNVEFFAEDKSVFSVILDPAATTETFIEDLTKIYQCVQQWKMLFNSDTSKQTQETVCSRKIEVSL